MIFHFKNYMYIGLTHALRILGILLYETLRVPFGILLRVRAASRRQAFRRKGVLAVR
ncbi:hypothetical protein NIES25_02270 [Nostoc linckia NIES-25]|nr:hypothetical protein NIES25_02270 [Nostoc linckia NIES-25]